MNQGERGISTNILIGEQRGLLIIAIPLVVVIAGVLVLSLIHPVKAQKNSSSVSLSLEPKEIRVPYMKNEITDLILVELKIDNVTKLKEFHFEIWYNSNVLSYFSGKMDSHFFASSGGWEGGAFDGILGGSFSGSSTMLIYAFKVRTTGSTAIEMTESELIDENGNTIPHTTSGTTVEIVSFDNWVNGEYAKLKEKFDRLNENFADLEGKYENLKVSYSSLVENHASLEEKYRNLFADYENLSANYSTLTTDYDSLMENHARLEGRYENLSANYESLNENYLNLLSTYNELLENYGSVLDNLDSVVRERDDLEGKVHSLQKSLAEKKTGIENMETELASLQNQLKEKKSEISQQSSEIESLNDRVLAWQIGTAVAGLIAALVVIFYIFKLRRTEG